MNRTALLALALLVALPGPSAARSKEVRAAFQRHHPCPANGKRAGACPGYVVDHVRPLCAGGPDAEANMQWQAYRESLAKDRVERAQCQAWRLAHLG